MKTDVSKDSFNDMHAQSIDNLPAVQTATLPAAYESAKTALAKCVRIDECKKWADKAAALASYAKQAADDSLEKQAIRIRGRAIRRAGELLETIEPSKPGSGIGRGGASPSKRKQAASDAGMSVDQQKQAQRVARIPKDEFEKQIESEKPPTVSQLEKQRRKPPPFTREQVTKAKAKVWLSSALDRIEELDNTFEWDDFTALADADNAIDLANRCRNAARVIEEIAKCIQHQT